MTEKVDVFKEIERARGRQHLPKKVILPQKMFAVFKEDVESTGHKVTFWGVPVVAGNVRKITFVT